MRHILPAVTAIVLAAPVLAQDPGGISTSAISRCAGKVGMDTRQSDPAFGIITASSSPAPQAANENARALHRHLVTSH